MRESKPYARPLLCVVHDDAGVLDLLARDLGERFGTHYDVDAHPNADAALAVLRAFAADGRPVAAVFAGDTDACGGDAFRAEAHDLHPGARRVLLVGRGEWSKRHPAVAAMRSGQADSYVFVPWGPRERWLYLPVGETLAEWEASQPPAAEVVRLVGEEWEPRAFAVRDLLTRLGLPLGSYRPDSAEGRAILEQAGLDDPALPVLVFRGGAVLVDPSYEDIAATLGFSTEPEVDRCDLAVVGGGPAGLAAAVYGASEGLATVVVDGSLPGGQAGTSSRIRNYLGFPTGLSGRDLTNRALEQAWFFGARMVLSKPATGISPVDGAYAVDLAGPRRIVARTVVVSTGVTWRRLGVPALEALQGAGVFYGAAASDAAPLENGAVFVVGAGNSAGQAAVHLARAAGSVTLLVRGDRLGATMSDYLVDELAATPNIRVRLHTEVVDGGGPSRLAHVTLRDRVSGATEEVGADALYVMIGARPHTEWLAAAVARDEQGYVLTGRDVPAAAAGWVLERPPMLLETSLPGVFAAGDVRHGSIKRVASAVGEGSIAVQLVHLRLAELG